MHANKMKRSVFAHRLRMLRRQMGVTQKEIAQSLNIDRSTYAYYETDKTNPDLITLRRIASIFHVSTDYLLGIETPAIHAAPVRDRGAGSRHSRHRRGSYRDYRRMNGFSSSYTGQLDTEQRENLVRYVMDTINRELPSEADPQGSG